MSTAAVLRFRRRTAAAKTTRARCSSNCIRRSPWDERYDWRKRFGGEAVREMLVRYGWPAFSAYAGDYEETSHASWMSFYDSTRTATAEYPQDRVHLIPQWNAVTDPFHAPADAWQLNMPPLNDDDEPAGSGGPTSTTRRAAARIAQLREQTVMLRRDDDSCSPPRRSCGLRDASSTAIRRRRCSSARRRPTHPAPAARAFTNATSLVLTARIPASPAVVGTEVLAPRGELSARTRFGITPPAPLSALKPGETAISDPVLSRPTSRSNGPEGALAQMLGSTVVRWAQDRRVLGDVRLRGRRLGGRRLVISSGASR